MRFLTISILAVLCPGCRQPDGPEIKTVDSGVSTVGDQDASPSEASSNHTEPKSDPSDPTAPGYNPQARAEELRRGVGPFFVEPTDTVLDLRVFKPRERRTYTLDEKEDHNVNIFMYVDAPEDLIDRVGMTEWGTPKVGLIEVTNDKFDNKGIGNYRVTPTLSGYPPWEIAVENLTDKPLLFQIVKFAGEMSEAEKARQAEDKSARERAKKMDRFREAQDKWRADPVGPAPKKEDFGLR